MPCELLRVSHLSYPIVCCEPIRTRVHFQTLSFHFMGLKSCLSHHCLLPHCAWVFSFSLHKHQRNSWYGTKAGGGKLPRGQRKSQEAVQPSTFPVISRPSPRPYGMPGRASRVQGKCPPCCAPRNPLPLAKPVLGFMPCPGMPNLSHTPSTASGRH